MISTFSAAILASLCRQQRSKVPHRYNVIPLCNKLQVARNFDAEFGFPIKKTVNWKHAYIQQNLFQLSSGSSTPLNEIIQFLWKTKIASTITYL
jgi:hypothetical protein